VYTSTLMLHTLYLNFTYVYLIKSEFSVRVSRGR